MNPHTQSTAEPSPYPSGIARRRLVAPLGLVALLWFIAWSLVSWVALALALVGIRAASGADYGEAADPGSTLFSPQFWLLGPLVGLGITVAHGLKTWWKNIPTEPEF